MIHNCEVFKTWAIWQTFLLLTEHKNVYKKVENMNVSLQYKSLINYTHIGYKLQRYNSNC